MALTWTTQHLKDLEEAMAQGVQRVEYNDRTVIYRSLQEMKETRELIKRALGLNKRGGRLLCTSSKGTT